MSSIFVPGLCTIPIVMCSLGNPATFCWFISFCLSFIVAHKDLSKIPPVVQLRHQLRYAHSGFIATLIDLLNTHVR